VRNSYATSDLGLHPDPPRCAELRTSSLTLLRARNCAQRRELWSFRFRFPPLRRYLPRRRAREEASREEATRGV
jgi:hypothetical protein